MHGLCAKSPSCICMEHSVPGIDIFQPPQWWWEAPDNAELQKHGLVQDESLGTREEIKRVAPKSSPCEGGPKLEVQ